MTHCDVCSTPFPDSDYLDIYGVCGSAVCQDEKYRLILQEKWFDSQKDQKDFQERNKTELYHEDVYDDALSSLIMLRCTDNSEFTAAMRGCIATSSKHYVLNLIIQTYKEILRDLENF